MKKHFSILLILIFILGLTPVDFSLAITQNQISSTVSLACTDDGENWSLGSGTIIDSKGIILTNKHVVQDSNKNIMKYCLVAITESISQTPDFLYIAETKYWTTDDYVMDSALLYIDNKNNKIFPYVDIWESDSSSLFFGDEIEVVGYPVTGGSTITYTSGDFSGFGSSINSTQNYIKSTAILEHGNSGGGAYDSNGNYIGIPSMVVRGDLNSMGYILHINSIKKWLSEIVGSNYISEIQAVEVEVDEKGINSTTHYSSDAMPTDLTVATIRLYPIDESDNILWDKELDIDNPQPYSKFFYEIQGLPDSFEDYGLWIPYPQRYGLLSRLLYKISISKDSFEDYDDNIIYNEPSSLVHWYGGLNFQNPNTPSGIGVITGTVSLNEEGIYYIRLGSVKVGKFVPGSNWKNIKSETVYWKYNYQSIGTIQNELNTTDLTPYGVTQKTLSGTLVKSPETTAVFLAVGTTRYAFNNQSIYESWYGDDFSSVQTISINELASYQLVGSVTYKPGSLIKIPSIPKVYLVTDNGVLRWIQTEQKLFDLGFSFSQVQDLSEAFFLSYSVGEDI